MTKFAFLQRYISHVVGGSSTRHGWSNQLRIPRSLGIFRFSSSSRSALSFTRSPRNFGLFQGQCRIKFWVENEKRHFRLIDYGEGTNKSCESKHYKSPSQATKKVSFKYTHYIRITYQRPWLRSGQMRLLNENVAWALCNTCFLGQLGRKIWWWHSFSDLIPMKIKVRSNLKIWNLLSKTCWSYPVLSPVLIPRISFIFTYNN